MAGRNPAAQRWWSPPTVMGAASTNTHAGDYLVAGEPCREASDKPDNGMARLARQSGIAVEVVNFEDWDPAGV